MKDSNFYTLGLQKLCLTSPCIRIYDALQSMGCSCFSLNSLTLAWNKMKEHVVTDGAEAPQSVLHLIYTDRLPFQHTTNKQNQPVNPVFLPASHMKARLLHVWKLRFTSWLHSSAERGQGIRSTAEWERCGGFETWSPSAGQKLLTADAGESLMNLPAQCTRMPNH